MASLIPLINSAKYRDKGQYFYEKHKIHFLNILKSESYYLLRELPRHILEPLFMPHVPELLKKQRANRMWKRTDGERVTNDILAALRKCDSELLSEARLPNSPYEQVKDKTDLHSVLIKRLLPNGDRHADEARRLIEAYYAEQEDTGSWHATVVGTVATLDTLLLLGADADGPEMRAGIRFLLDNLNPTQDGLHIEEPYGFTAHYMFSTQDRNREFAVALKLKPEWIPRNVCFRHLGAIQNALCVNLLLKLGLEDTVIPALDNLNDMERQWDGFCDSDIKKKYLSVRSEQ